MFSTALELILNVAYREAAARRHTHLTLEHLLYALAHDPDGEKILAACGGDLRQTDARVARRGLHDGGAGGEQSLLFRVEHHRERRPVLDGAAGVHAFQLDPNLGGIGFDDPLQPHHGGAPDERIDHGVALRRVIGSM